MFAVAVVAVAVQCAAEWWLVVAQAVLAVAAGRLAVGFESLTKAAVNANLLPERLLRECRWDESTFVFFSLFSF